MNILEPKDIQQSKRADIEDATARVRDLASEELRLGKAVNNLRAEHDLLIEQRKRNYTTDEVELLTKKNALIQEVNLLEGRKREAMKPVDILRDEATATIKKYDDKVALLGEYEQQIGEREQKIRIYEGSLIEKKNDLAKHAESLNRRELDIKTKEEDLKKSEELLRDKWVGYYEGVAKLNEKVSNVEERESRARDHETANNIYKETLNKKELELSERERRLVDGYATLDSARKEILEGKLQ